MSDVRRVAVLDDAGEIVNVILVDMDILTPEWIDEACGPKATLADAADIKAATTPTGKETMKRVQLVEPRIAPKEPIADVALVDEVPLADEKA